MSTVGYYALSEVDIEQATEIYLDAFDDDPFFRALMPDASTRKTLLRPFFRAVTAYNVKFGEIYGIGSPLQGLASWHTPTPRPNREKETLRGVMQCGFNKVIFSGVIWKWVKFWAMGRKIEKARKAHAPKAYYYLEILAVAPESHGKKLASQLLRPMIAKAHSEGFPVYLETSNPKNVGVYEHFGFTCIQQVTVGRKKIPVWVFSRP